MIKTASTSKTDRMISAKYSTLTIHLAYDIAHFIDSYKHSLQNLSAY